MFRALKHALGTAWHWFVLLLTLAAAAVGVRLIMAFVDTATTDGAAAAEGLLWWGLTAVMTLIVLALLWQSWLQILILRHRSRSGDVANSPD